MQDPVIEIKDLSFSYNGSPILSAVNLTIQAREFLAVIGPNGGGKTTLLKLILGLLAPDQGLIRIFGLPPREAAPRIGYVPQEIRLNKAFPVSVLNIVLMGRMKEYQGWRRFSKQDKAAALQALEQLQVADFRKRRFNELSGGQRQRVLMARALVTEPELLLLDEPTSNVDTKGQSDFYDFLQKLNQTVTILVVTHDVMALSSYIRSVACVSRQVIFHNAPEVTREMVEMAYQCPVDIIAHGLPHRVFHHHHED